MRGQLRIFPSILFAFEIIYFLLQPALLPAQSHFGKNKIRFKKINWDILKTPHFDIYHDRQYPEVAKRAAIIAEASAAKLSKKYTHALTEIIPLVIFSSPFNFFNNHIIPVILSENTGGFTEIFRNRVVIPFTGKWDVFHHVLEHEISHAYQFNILYQKSPTDVSRIVKKTPSLWIMEGLSEHFSIGEEASSILYERDGILTGMLPSLEMMEYPQSLGPAGYYLYKGSQSFFNWLQREYGEKKVADFFFAVVKLPSSQKASKEVFNKSLEELSDSWQRSLKKKYWPSIDKLEPPEKRARRITYHFEDKSTYNRKPVLGKNGRYLYFYSDKKIYTQIVQYDRKKERITDILVSEEKDNFYESLNVLGGNLSLDAQRNLLHFVSRRGERFYFNLYSLKKKKVIQRHVLRMKGVYASSISPDGSQVAFIGHQGKSVDLYIYDFKTKKLVRLTEDDFREDHPTWSADKKKLVFSSNRDFGIYSPLRNLHILNIETREIENLSPSEATDHQPSWSDDGKKIAFISDRDGVANLYIKDLESRELLQSTRVIGAVEHPCWGVKNKEIAYTVFHEAGYDVFIQSFSFNQISPNSKKPVRRWLEAYEKSPPSSQRNTSLNIQTKEKIKPQLIFEQDTVAYKPRVLPQIFQGSFGGSSSGGIGGHLLMTGSDMLGEYQIELNTFLSYQSRHKIFDTDTVFSIFNLKNRVHYGFAGDVFQFNFFSLENPAEVFTSLNAVSFVRRFRETRFGLAALGRYAFDKYNRLDFSVALRYHQREFIDVDETFFMDPRYEKLVEFQAMAYPVKLAYVHDSTLQGYLHPLDNRRSIIEIEAAPPLHRSSLGYFKWFTDIRAYALVARFASFALRFMSGYVTGASKNEFRFQIGGGAIHSDYPYLRGYPFGQFLGSKMFLLNLEYRSVLLDFAQFSFPFKWRLRGIGGILFWDLGAAFDEFENFKPWDHRGVFSLEDLKMSFGFGLRFVFFFFPLKFDFASPFTGHSIARFKDWNFFFSLGFDF